MPTIPLPDNSVVNVQFIGRLNNQQIITLFQYKYQGATSPSTDYETYFDALEAKFAAALGLENRFLDMVGNNYHLDTVRIQAVYPTRMRFKDYPKLGSGTFASASLTSNLAVSVERYGRTNGRRSIGRVQVPLPDGVYSSGLVSDATYQGIVDIFAVVAGSRVSTTGTGTIGDWDPVIHHTYKGQTVTTLVDAYVRKSTVRTMHRRTVGVGK